MSNIITVMKKEFARFFYDRRMIMMVLLPAVLIYAVYTLMGTAMETAFAPDAEEETVIHAVFMPDIITAAMQDDGFTPVYSDMRDVESIKEQITQQNVHVLIIFPDYFEEMVRVYDAQTATEPAPDVNIYYNSVNPTSSNAYIRITSILDVYESRLANKFDINRDIQASADLATVEDRTATVISSLLPMLLMIFLYSGSMGLALESITGEKERGTLATLLVSPLKRRELAIGKILSLAVLSFISGGASAIATILALPNLMGAADEIDVTAIYDVTAYAFLALVILSTLLLLVAMISIVSAFAKTVKEAGSAVMPLMILVMLVGVTGMFGGGAQTNPAYYIIPLYGNVQSMIGIFSRDYYAVNIAISALSTTAFACIGGYVLTKMFNSEKVMFSR